MKTFLNELLTEFIAATTSIFLPSLLAHKHLNHFLQLIISLVVFFILIMGSAFVFVFFVKRRRGQKEAGLAIRQLTSQQVEE